MDRRETLSVREAREQLSQLLDVFRAGDTNPVFLGSQRKTEAVMLPIAVYNHLVEERTVAVGNALGSLHAEGLTPDDETLAIMERWRAGEIDAHEMRRLSREVNRRYT